MTFEEFINKCSSYIDIDKLYFEHHYCKHDNYEFVNSYKVQIRGTNFRLYYSMNEKVIIIHIYTNIDTFYNMPDLDTALKELKKYENK